MFFKYPRELQIGNKITKVPQKNIFLPCGFVTERQPASGNIWKLPLIQSLRSIHFYTFLHIFTLNAFQIYLHAASHLYMNPWLVY